MEVTTRMRGRACALTQPTVILWNPIASVLGRKAVLRSDQPGHPVVRRRCQQQPWVVPAELRELPVTRWISIITPLMRQQRRFKSSSVRVFWHPLADMCGGGLVCGFTSTQLCAHGAHSSGRVKVSCGRAVFDDNASSWQQLNGHLAALLI